MGAEAAGMMKTPEGGQNGEKRSELDGNARIRQSAGGKRPGWLSW